MSQQVHCRLLVAEPASGEAVKVHIRRGRGHCHVRVSQHMEAEAYARRDVLLAGAAAEGWIGSQFNKQMQSLIADWRAETVAAAVDVQTPPGEGEPSRGKLVNVHIRRGQDHCQFPVPQHMAAEARALRDVWLAPAGEYDRIGSRYKDQMKSLFAEWCAGTVAAAADVHTSPRKDDTCGNTVKTKVLRGQHSKIHAPKHLAA